MIHSDTNLPEGWARVPLSEVISPSKAKVEPAEQPDAPYLSLEHIEQNTGRIIGCGRGTDVTSTKAVFRAGDVLYGKLRPYLNKVCIPDFDGICSTDILVFSQTEYLDSQYVMRFLMQRHVVEYAHHHSAGVQLPRVSFDELSELGFPLPPQAEQKRIVAKMEALLARVNAARERLAKAPALLKRFRQSVLAAACSGQLTETWRLSHTISESASALIDRIAASRPAGTRVFDSGIPQGEDLPDGWARTTIGFLAEPTLNGRPYVTSGSRGWARYVSDRGPYFIRSENINTDTLWIKDAVKVAAPAGAETDRTRVIDADLLLTITGNNVGRTAVVPTDTPTAHVSQHVAIIRTTRLSDVHYLWLWLRSRNHGQGQLKEHFYGETKPGLNLDQVKSVWVDLPPLDEQREIVRRVEALFALADKIEARVQAATARVEKTTQAILAKAFRGELVPTEAELTRQEGRGYEPASVLLARIQEARKQHKPARRGHGGQKMAKRSTGRQAATERTALDEVLREQGKPLTPERLFDLAGFDEGSVDGFYEQLRKLIQGGKVRENRPNKKDVTLEAVRA